MRAGSFRYLVREGMRSLWVNRLMSLASIGVLVSCLLLIGTSVLFSININSMVGYIENQNEVVVFLDDDLQLPLGQLFDLLPFRLLTRRRQDAILKKQEAERCEQQQTQQHDRKLFPYTHFSAIAAVAFCNGDNPHPSREVLSSYNDRKKKATNFAICCFFSYFSVVFSPRWRP